MVATIESSTSQYDRRTLIKRLAAAGFAVPVIASIVADGAWAQDVATPMDGTPASGSPAALPELASPFTIIPPMTTRPSRWHRSASISR